jgi:pimeloyl-ACP methyl ester carboxylesterase
MTVSENRMRTLVQRSVGHGGGYPSLEAHVFGGKTILTGMVKPERFTAVIGFWMFLTEPRRPGTTPVVLVHGHSAGPRPYAPLAESLRRQGFEPWFTFYATGNRIKTSAALLRQSLSRTAERYDVDEVQVISYSLGGLVALQALRTYDDGLELPRIPVFVGVSVPWGGSEERWLETEVTWAPSAWDDMRDGSHFLTRLYDDPLPPGTEFHSIYGLGGEPDDVLGEQNDRVLSEASMSRPEATAEASSVTVYPDLTHVGIIRDPRTIDKIGQLLAPHAGRRDTGR